MALADEQYSRVMHRLEHDLPDVADQVGRESRGGRVVTEDKLRRDDRADRAERLYETKLPPLGKTDVAVVPYSVEERLELVRDALITLAMSMDGSRRELARLASEFGITPVVIFSDEESVGEELSLDVELRRTSQVVRQVRTLLDEDFDDRGDK
ncbi:hypothetical protein [Actinokineospora inagensis]|uniref:hypothetical protein n=1 Tax=Actinokineospora inagensis TaxID=103730 RepID=UPI0012FB908C|nr:hypothetical protein [Actinokineospora inagensis]